jgi:hypothetical protein
MKKRTMLIGGVVIILLAVLMKWWWDVVAFDEAQNLARMRVNDLYGVKASLSLDELEKELAKTDEKMSRLGYVWFASGSEKAEVRRMLEEYRRLVEEKYQKVRRELMAR